MSLDQDASMHWQAKRSRDDQLCYYLLSLAAGGLALVFSKTEAVAMSWEAAPALATFALFTLSMLFGIMTINSVRGAHGIELVLAQWRRSATEEQKQSAQYAADVLGQEQALDEKAATANTLFAFQYWTMGAGAVGLVAWRIYEMLRLAGAPT